MNIQPPSVAHAFAAAFNSRDVARLLTVFTADAVYHDLFYGSFAGQQGLRELFERMYAEGSRHAWTMGRVMHSDDATIGEWRFEFTISPAVRHGAGRTLRFPGVSVFETRDGRCHTYREYFDRAAALLAGGVPSRVVAGIVARRTSIEVTGGEDGTPGA